MNAALKADLKKLESIRRSRAIVYITSDKPNFQAIIANDVYPFFYEQLRKIGKTNRISLFIYSEGGNLEAPWPIVNLIREYCNEFEIIIPYKAYSAASLICLGADKLVMTPISQLSPIDPIGEFISQNNKHERIQIEDVIGYVDFAKDRIGISEQTSLLGILNKLSEQIQPTIIGNINRTHKLIRSLAEKNLLLHQKKLDGTQVRQIVENLTEKLYSHHHFINREEAKRVIGFKNIIKYATLKEEELINNIMQAYTDKLTLKQLFDPISFLGAENEKEFKIVRALVHTTDIEYNFVSKYKVTKIPSPTGQMSININNFYNIWE